MNQPDKLIADAVKKMQAGKFAEAEEIYRKVIKRDPYHADGHYLLGSLLAEKGDFKLAEKHLGIALELLPASPYIWNNLGNLRLMAGDDNGALAAWTTAVKFNPNLAEAWCNVGLIHMRNINLEDAERCMRRAVSIKNISLAWCTLANIAERQGKEKEAADICGKVLKFEPDNQFAQFMLSRLEGNPMASPPSQTIRKLFDGYARRFEAHLVGELAYSIPDRIIETIKTHRGEQRFSRAVDLGCGTGLMGLRMANRVGELVGVDLSPKMLGVAREKGVYQRLVESDLTEFLAAEDIPFDLFLAADVLNYLGELEDLFRTAFTKSAEKSIFVFSTEKAHGEGWELRSTGRYAHSISFVRQCAERAGWSVLVCEEVTVRLEGKTPVVGNLFLLIRQ